MGLPTKEQIGSRFAQILERDLTRAEWREMKAENARLRAQGSDCCASHDFVDANMSMDEAFRSFNVEPLPEDQDGMPQEIADLWNAAWDYAKAKFLTDRFCEGQPVLYRSGQPTVELLHRAVVVRMTETGRVRLRLERTGRELVVDARRVEELG